MKTSGITRRDHDHHWHPAQIPFYGGAVVLYAGLDPLLKDWGLPLLVRWPIWAAISATWLLPFAFVAATSDSDRFRDARVTRPVVLACACAISAAGALVLLRTTNPPLPVIGSVSGIAIFGAVVWIAVLLQTRDSPRAATQRPVHADRADEAEELVGMCRCELAAGGQTDDERDTVRLNLAGGLVVLGQQTARDDLLLEACAIYDEIAVAAAPEGRFAATEQLVEAMTVKAECTYDLEGYEQALARLLAVAADAASVVPDAESIARGIRARSLVRLADRATADARAARAEALRVRAVDELRLALATTSAGSVLEAQHTLTLAPIAESDLSGAEVDAAIKTCRRALRRLWGEPWAIRAPGQLALVDLLTRRADLHPAGGVGAALDALWPGRPHTGIVERLWPDRESNDLLRASVICMRLASRDELNPHAVLRANELNHRLRTIKNRMKLSNRPMALTYKHAFAAQYAISPASAIELAANWARWAASRGDAKQAADAHWAWITAVVAAARRGVLRDDKQPQLERIQGRIAEAGYRLLMAGRPADAAVAVELGRAILLTERLQRDRPDVEQRLAERGEHALLARWRDARDRVQAADRSADAPARDAPGTGARPDGAQQFASPEYVALAEHESLLRAIGDLPGFDDVVATLDYEDLRSAASEGPLVYVCATDVPGDERGFALIVSEAAAPHVIMLPGLTVAESERRAARLANVAGSLAINEAYEELRPWMWDTIMRPIAARVARPALVTLIPVGVIGLLPLHVSGLTYDDGVWHDATDGLVFRFVPNARVLMRARDTAEALADKQPGVLTVPVERAPHMRPLPQAPKESAGVRRRFGERTEQPAPATVEAVLAGLGRSAIWHFACHCVHDVGKPLESRLCLEDGDLTLATIFSQRPGRRRLAVLSACRAAAPDGTLLDEVVSFPGAMLQAGVAGVMSSHVEVQDLSASLLVLRFFDGVRAGIGPAYALAEAQRWLRSATNEQIHEALPHDYQPPEGMSPDELAWWQARRPYLELSSWATFSYSGA